MSVQYSRCSNPTETGFTTLAAGAVRHGFFDETYERTSEIVPLKLLALLSLCLTAQTLAAQVTHAYVVNETAETVSVIDTTASPPSVVATIPVGGVGPFDLEVSPDGSLIYVPNNGGADVSVIDTGTNAVVAIVGVPSRPRRVAFTPDGSQAWVTSRDCTCVSVIDTSTHSVLHTVPTGGGQPAGVAITPDGTRAYVSNRNSANVAVIDATTSPPTLVTNIPDLPPGTSPLSKLDLGPFEVHSMV